MKILVSNDDGVHAQGLHTLAEAVRPFGEIKVVAPDRDHSGASNSLTLTRPLRIQTLPNGFISIDGTPTDCVHMGLSKTFDFKADRVVSGINTHANLGDDVLYSGTVAAAMEGRFLGIPAIAVSLVNRGNDHYATAAEVVARILGNAKELSIAARTVLNINVPDVPIEQIKGIKVTRLGHRAKGGDPEEIVDPRGRRLYWIATAGEGDDSGEGTDFHAVEHNYVSITPIHVDMTRYDAFSSLTDWLQD